MLTIRYIGPRTAVINHQTLRHGERLAVPAALAQRLAAERPDAITIVAPDDGLALPADGQVRTVECATIAEFADVLRDADGTVLPVPTGDLAADLDAPAELSPAPARRKRP